jgi:2,3-diketo-5-methylthio-1-phosphopentane phosphatase
MPAVDLARAAVFLDFDGTLTTADVGVHLLDRLAPPEWRAIDAQYDDGVIGSRACLLAEWELLPRDRELLRAVGREVPLDPGVGALVAGLRAGGAEVTVVSDGFGYYVEDLLGPVLAAHDVGLVTNAVDWDRGTLHFPYADATCACAACGTCKPVPVEEARRRGRTTVLVGDGTSDRWAARVADVVFAKVALAEWCRAQAVDHVPFATLDDVRRVLCP